MHRTSGRDDSQAAILLYHRLSEEGRDPLGLNVTPCRFAEHVEVISSRYATVPLAKVTSAIAGGTGRNFVAITFDDAYRGVLDAGRPVLERHGVPATTFVPAAMIDQAREFWWEELEQMVFEHGVPVPVRLELPGGSTFVWKPRRGLARLLRRNRIPGALGTYIGLMKALRLMGLEERKQVVDALRRISGADQARSRTSRMALDGDGLRELSKGGLIEIGAHTVNHPVLATLSSEEQQQEICGSKKMLERRLGAPVTSFAYPYGGGSDYGRVAIDAVYRAGFVRACANVPGLVDRGTDVLQLPRFIVGDWDGETFARRLEEWFSYGRRSR